MVQLVSPLYSPLPYQPSVGSGSPSCGSQSHSPLYGSVSSSPSYDGDRTRSPPSPVYEPSVRGSLLGSPFSPMYEPSVRSSPLDPPPRSPPCSPPQDRAEMMEVMEEEALGMSLQYRDSPPPDSPPLPVGPGAPASSSRHDTSPAPVAALSGAVGAQEVVDGTVGMAGPSAPEFAPIRWNMSAVG